MTTDVLDIKSLIGETTAYDKKQMLEERKPKSWLKSVSALANGEGGALIFGIADDGEVVGLQEAQHDAEIISEQIKTKMDPVPEVNLGFHKTDDGKELIVLKVRPGDETPYFYFADGNRTAFVRIGNESVPADSMMLKRLVLKGYKRSFDSMPSEYKFNQMAFTKLRSICFQRTHNEFLDTDYESWGITSDGVLTNAGALLADECPIHYSRVFCTRWNGLDKAGGVVDALDDAEYSGSLLILLQDMMSFINRNNHKAWMKTKDGRIEMPDYPDRALLETCVNSLIHRDYLEYGSEVHVDIYDDRIEVYSPGGMFDGTLVQNLDLMNVESKRRNPVIADIFSRLNLMDRRGSGFKKIIRDYKGYETYTPDKKPSFRSDAHNFFTVLPNLNYGHDVEYVEENGREELSSGLGNNRPKENVTKDVTKRYEAILALVSFNREMTVDEIAGTLKVNRRTILRDIDYLRTHKKIKRVGGRKDGHWESIDGQETGN